MQTCCTAWMNALLSAEFLRFLQKLRLSKTCAASEVWHVQIVTWVEKNDGSKAPQFSLVHLHVSHLWHQFCEHSAEEKKQKVRSAVHSRPGLHQSLFLGYCVMSDKQTTARNTKITWNHSSQISVCVCRWLTAPHVNYPDRFRKNMFLNRRPARMHLKITAHKHTVKPHVHG